MRCRALIVTVVLSLAISVAAADDWKQIEQGYVRVSMPAAPKHSTSAIDGTPAELFVWKDAAVVLQLEIAYGFFSGRDIEKTLDMYALYGETRPPISKTPFTDASLTNGREVMFRAANKSESIKRMFVFEGALYIMTATFPGAADRALANKYFGSLGWGPWPDASLWMSWETQECQCKYGMPDRGEKRSTTSTGGHTQNMWILTRDKIGDRFVVMASLGSAKDAPAEAMVDAAADASMRGKQGERKKIKIGTHPGRELVVVADGVKTITRMYVANGHIYALAYVAPVAAVDAVARDYFFQMFQPLLKAR